MARFREFHRAGCAHDAATGRLSCPQHAMRYLDLAAPDASARPESGLSEEKLRSTGNARERHGLFRCGAL
jgi:hypothetical protein